MNRTGTKSLLAIAALSSLAALGAILFLFLSIRRGNEDIGALQDRIVFEQASNQRLALMKSSLASSAALRADLDSYFATKEGVVDFLNGIEQLAARSGASMKVSSVTEEASADGSNLPVLHISLDAQGTWVQVASFGEMLRLLPYKTDFVGMNLALQGKEAFDAKGKPIKNSAATWKGDYEFTVLKAN